MAETPQPATPMPPPAPQAVAPTPRPGPLARTATLLGLVLLALAYILPGLTGHDPWTPDETHSLGLVHGMVTSGDLVVPTLAGEPSLEPPPAYALSATGMVRLLADWLPLHDAARVASGVYVALTLIFAGLMARRAWGPGLGGAAVLALLGSLGLMQHGHLMVPDLVLTAGMGMGAYGLLRARESVAWGGLWLGTGAGLAFMSQGPLWAGVLGLAALLLPLFSDWRNRKYPWALAVALVVAAPWLLVWPTELYLRAPDLFRAWLRANDPRPYLGPNLNTVHLGPPPQADFWLRTLPWVTFPLWPLALWTLARRPRLALGNPGVRVALVVSALGWGVLLYSSTARDLQALPLLAPLAVIAAGGVRDLPGWLVGLCYWVSLLAFAALAAALWGLWGYGLAAGQPPQWDFIGRYLPLGFHPVWDQDAALLALALSLAWVVAVKRLRPARPGALAAWPLGLTLAWGLVALLHLPWLDAARSDRGVFAELAARLPAGAGCVAAPAEEEDPARATDWTRMRPRGSELALLRYFAGIETVSAANLAGTACDWALLRAGTEHSAVTVDLGPGWSRVWEGRPADRRDTFILFRRVQAPVAAVAPAAAKGPADPAPAPAATPPEPQVPASPSGAGDSPP